MKNLLHIICLLSAQLLSAQGVRIYNGTNQDWQTTNVELWSGTYKNAGIPNGLNNKATSIKVYQGFQVTFSAAGDGKGYSKTYIARSGNLNKNLPAELNNQISYIKVVPHKATNKKGVGRKPNSNNGNQNGATLAGLVSANWYYDWGRFASSTSTVEYVPMAWGSGAANDHATIANISNVSHLLPFNEPDNSHESNLYPYQARDQYEKLLMTGLRLGSPATTESAHSWRNDFVDMVHGEEYRMDFIAVHWYDWGGNPKTSKGADANQIFNRFKAYVQKIHNDYGLPIWITEFNANPWRYTYVQKAFMEKAIAWLEHPNQDYVERYAWFECFDKGEGRKCDLTDSNGNITDLGNTYKDETSGLAITANSWYDPTLLSLLDPTPNNRVTEAPELSEIIESEEVMLKLIPNPVTDFLTIKGIGDGDLVEVINIKGQSVFKKTGSPINISSLSSGIYFAKVNGRKLKFMK
jgi:hypothetical protein